MLASDTRAAKGFYREIRRFAESAQTWNTGVVWYETKPDERFDLSLVSMRVYGRRDEFFAVLAAAGLDGFDQPLTERMLVMPSDFRLTQIKRATGFESVAALRSRVAGKDAALPEPVTPIIYPAIEGLPASGGGPSNVDVMALIATHVAQTDPHNQYLDTDDVIDGGTY